MIPFSVLLSIYKNEKPQFLFDSLNSIIELQILKPNEIILVKDGLLSKELDEVILFWENKYPNIIRVINLDVNMGLGKALNEGLKYCSNSWVFRMDTDDISVPDRFLKQLIFIKDNPDIVLLGSGIEEVNRSLTVSFGYKSVPITLIEIKNYLKKRNPFNHVTVAFNINAIRSVGGYQHHLYMEDYNLWLRVIAAGYKVANIDEPLVKVRTGDSMVSRRRGLGYIKSEFQLAKLKVNLGFVSPLSSVWIFFLRSFPRLLPTFILSKIYKRLRK
ncbi:glycosyltransferase [Arsenophonus sp. aPb]|uniref:glycosyltransferase n=1 Tax=Arsenophonus sp. aPb TaxID=3041619 RepID=UPI002468AC8F|nr:glycosyltransferase [Arsenophonus sp. aPb]WGL98422.1 glycosyltransferase [Arsenophonus sp. aPb]